MLVNDANIQSQIGHNPCLCDLIDFVMTNRKTLHGTSRSWLSMGRRKLTTMQAVSFGTMVNMVECLVEDTQSFFKKLMGKTVLFICVGNDIWGGKSKSVLGLCVFLVLPLLKEMIAIRTMGRKQHSLQNSL
jgi:hypothetical protein